MFGDALAGSGGMAEPVQPNLFAGVTPADIFPDALSGVLVAGATVALPTPDAGPAPVTAGGQLPGGRAPMERRPVGSGRQAPQRSSAGVVRPPPGSRPRPTQPGAPAPTQPWAPVPPAGPPGRYASVSAIPTVAPSSRRPTAGTGNVPAQSSAALSRLIRPPAYLPQDVGLAQVRAALQKIITAISQVQGK